MRKSILAALVAALIAAGLIATAVSVAEPPFPGDDWPRAKPEERGLDPSKLAELTREIKQGDRRFPNVHSLLIVRGGDLVFEEYFDGWSAERLHTLQSVSKSFTSALIGIAIGRGEIEGVEEKVLDFFPEMKDLENLDDRKRAMTLEDLLTMRSGTDYHESHFRRSPHSELIELDRGWDRFYLDRPMVHEPGSFFQYDSGGVILMSSILKNRTGMHADAYAERHLFGPLGITQSRWERNGEGHPHTGGGLYLRPRDMAKFGLLYLRGGRWGDRQVVPAEWVERSVRRHVARRDGRRVVGYGYLWWILQTDPEGAGEENVWGAWGFMGQYIFVVPEHDMVVVVTAGARAEDEKRLMDLLYTHVLPAVRGPAVRGPAEPDARPTYQVQKSATGTVLKPTL